MDMEPQPVRYRVVIELTFPDADPWDPSNHNLLIERMKDALVNTPNLKCKDVLIRESRNIGPDDDYGQWRGGPKYDFSSFEPNTGYLFSVSYPVAEVDATDLARVWEVLSKAETGELRNRNIAVTLGQALRPESDAMSTIARAHILRALQGRNALPALPLKQLLERAATMPIETRLQTEAALDALAERFRDESA